MRTSFCIGQCVMMVLKAISAGSCDAVQMRLPVPGYLNTWGLCLDEYQVYARFVLLDTVTGYRNLYRD